MIVRPLLCEISETDLEISDAIISPILRDIKKVCFVSAVVGCKDTDDYVRLELSNSTGQVIAFASDVNDIEEGKFVFVYGQVKISKRKRGIVSVRKIVPLDTTEVGELKDWYLLDLLDQLWQALSNYQRKKDVIAKKGREHYGDRYAEYRDWYNKIKQELMDRYNIEDEVPLPEEEEELEVDV